MNFLRAPVPWLYSMCDDPKTHSYEEEDHAGEREATGVTEIPCRTQENEPQAHLKNKTYM